MLLKGGDQMGYAINANSKMLILIPISDHSEVVDLDSRHIFVVTVTKGSGKP